MSERPLPAHLDARGGSLQRPTSRRTRELALVIGTAVAAPATGWLIRAAWASDANGEGTPWVLGGVTSALVFVFTMLWRQAIAHRLLGGGDLALDPPGPVELGSTLRFVLPLATAAVPRMTKTVATLIETEVREDPHRRRRGHRRSSVLSVLKQTDIPVRVERTADGARLVGELPIESDGRTSLREPHYRYDYGLHLRIEIRGWPDASFQQHVLIVRPEQRRAQGTARAPDGAPPRDAAPT